LLLLPAPVGRDAVAGLIGVGIIAYALGALLLNVMGLRDRVLQIAARQRR